MTFSKDEYFYVKTKAVDACTYKFDKTNLNSLTLEAIRAAPP